MSAAGAISWTPLPHVSVAGVRVATASRADLAEAMVRDCTASRDGRGPAEPRLVFDSNGHGISLAATDGGFRAALAQADVVHADGGFVVLASRWAAAAPIAERSATTDLLHDFARAAESAGLSFYLLGGTEAVNALCAERLRQLYPRLRIAGRQHGYFSAADEAKVIDDIALAAPDVLWVGLGKPREQVFAVAHRHRLRAGWIVTCGGCFNYVTGHYGRAPKWMQAMSLEWLYRAATDPRKLLWRYLTTSPHAIWLALRRADRLTYAAANSADSLRSEAPRAR